GKLDLSVLRGSVIAKDVQIADDPRFSQQPFVQAKALSIGAEVWPLITSKELKINSVRLDEPKILLVNNAASKWNFESLGAKHEGGRTAAEGVVRGGQGWREHRCPGRKADHLQERERRGLELQRQERVPVHGRGGDTGRRQPEA